MSEAHPRGEPHSPRPRIFEPPATSSSSSSSSTPKASDVLTLDDYRRMRIKATQTGSLTGIFAGGALTFAAKRFGGKRITSNGLFLTFLLSTGLMTYVSSNRFLAQEIMQARSKAIAQSLPHPEGMSGETFLGDPAKHDTDTHA